MAAFDFVVIGGGSAGLTAAMLAVEAGAKVALVERTGRYGGQCRYTGCVPTKALLHTAQVLHTMRTHAAAAGLPMVDPEWDFGRIKAHKDDIILRAGRGDGYDAPHDYYAKGGRTFAAAAQFRSRQELVAGDEVLRADRFLIATGSRPNVPALPGLDKAGFVTYETILDLSELPASLLIVGGGPIGIEIGQMFRRFGSAVTVLEMSQQILPQADPEVAQALRSILEAEGTRFRCGVEVGAVERSGNAYVVTVQEQDRTSREQATQLLIAVGQQPNSDSLNLAAAGVKVHEDGSIVVDEQLHTTAPGIYACGDVASQYRFTHVAQYEAKIAVANALHDAGSRVDERVVPWAVYTDPPLAQVGLTEQEARNEGRAIATAQISLEDVERGLLVEKQQGLLKGVADRASGELLGVSLVSPRADDIIHEAALAIRLRLGARDIAQTIHAYPTFSEGLQQIAQQLAEAAG